MTTQNASKLEYMRKKGTGMHTVVSAVYLCNADEIRHSKLLHLDMRVIVAANLILMQEAAFVMVTILMG